MKRLKGLQGLRSELVFDSCPLVYKGKGCEVWGGRKLPKEGQSVPKVPVGHGHSGGKPVPAHPEPQRQMQREATCK